MLRVVFLSIFMLLSVVAQENEVSLTRFKSPSLELDTMRGDLRIQLPKPAKINIFIGTDNHALMRGLKVVSSASYKYYQH